MFKTTRSALRAVFIASWPLAENTYNTQQRNILYIPGWYQKHQKTTWISKNKVPCLTTALVYHKLDYNGEKKRYNSTNGSNFQEGGLKMNITRKHLILVTFTPRVSILCSKLYTTSSVSAGFWIVIQVTSEPTLLSRKASSISNKGPPGEENQGTFQIKILRHRTSQENIYQH